MSDNELAAIEAAMLTAFLRGIEFHRAGKAPKREIKVADIHDEMAAITQGDTAAMISSLALRCEECGNMGPAYSREGN